MSMATERGRLWTLMGGTLKTVSATIIVSGPDNDRQYQPTPPGPELYV